MEIDSQVEVPLFLEEVWMDFLRGRGFYSFVFGLVFYVTWGEVGFVDKLLLNKVNRLLLSILLLFPKLNWRFLHEVVLLYLYLRRRTSLRMHPLLLHLFHLHVIQINILIINDHINILVNLYIILLLLVALPRMMFILLF